MMPFIKAAVATKAGTVLLSPFEVAKMVSTVKRTVVLTTAPAIGVAPAAEEMVKATIQRPVNKVSAAMAVVTKAFA